MEGLFGGISSLRTKHIRFHCDVYTEPPTFANVGNSVTITEDLRLHRKGKAEDTRTFKFVFWKEGNAKAFCDLLNDRIQGVSKHAKWQSSLNGNDVDGAPSGNAPSGEAAAGGNDIRR